MPSVGGNVQTGIFTAATATGDRITAPNKTDPLLQVGDFYDNDVDLSVTKIDAPDPYDLGAGGPLTYTVEVKNNSGIWANNVMVTDTLDANTTFVSASDGGTHGGAVTWDLGALAPFGTKTLTLAVNVNPTAPVANVTGADPIAGSHVLADIAAYDLLNKIEISSMNDEPLPGQQQVLAADQRAAPQELDPHTQCPSQRRPPQLRFRAWRNRDVYRHGQE